MPGRAETYLFIRLNCKMTQEKLPIGNDREEYT
jgi:hypothetical protein